MDAQKLNIFAALVVQNEKEEREGNLMEYHSNMHLVDHLEGKGILDTSKIKLTRFNRSSSTARLRSFFWCKEEPMNEVELYLVSYDPTRLKWDSS